MRYQPSISKLPFATLTIAACALIITAFSKCSLALALAWNAQIAALITAHLSHWSWDHFFWDVGMFLLLGALLEGDLMIPAQQRDHFSRQHLGAHFIASSLFISLALLYTPASYELYRGLSGFCTVTYLLLLLRVGTFAHRQRNASLTVATALCTLGLLGKVLYEVVYSTPLFAEPSSFQVAPEAHLYGLLYVALFVAGKSICPRLVTDNRQLSIETARQSDIQIHCMK